MNTKILNVILRFSIISAFTFMAEKLPDPLSKDISYDALYTCAGYIVSEILLNSMHGGFNVYKCIYPVLYITRCIYCSIFRETFR